MDATAALRLARATQKDLQGKSATERLSRAGLDVGPTQEAQILDRLSQMPERCMGAYLQAMRGRARSSGIKAFCQMYMGWQDMANGIRNCTDLACPLYPYRPYKD